ncbi:hypothetical protein [Actinomadura sp. DC4]|uniref:hypothetical protein n=1 Tax=Actinomadura sp. DC4 TaxID=3055069 RepID=UPI0025AF4297|nr:hypothetical protein [Actinomadura sp. DC4]MDN3352520.1 hypothetical protein [Actinomadura sp. DC4]
MFRKSLKAAVSVLAAGTALAACGPAKPGAAAVIGNDRITVATLDSAVSRWSKELPKYPEAQQIVEQAQGQQSGQQVPFDPSSPRRSALFQLIEIRAWDQVAREKSIPASQGQVDAFIASQGGSKDLDAYVLAEGLPTSYADDFARTLLIQQTMLQRYGINPNQPADPSKQAQIEQLRSDYTGALRHLDITVNPRLGTFSHKTLNLGPVCPRLSTPDSGTPDGASGGVKCQV